MSNVPKLRFKEFEGEWNIKKIGDLTKLTDGVHFTPTYVKSGVPFWSVETISSNTHPKYISEEAHREATKRCFPQRNDILVTRIGTLGKPRLIDFDSEISIYVSLALIKSSKNFNSSFMKFYIESPMYQKEFLSKSLLTASPQKINMEDMKSTKVSLPSLPEQEKIASFLSLYDKKIELQEKKIESLKKYKKGMMQKIFSQELRFKDENGENYPEWEEKKVKDIFNITRGEVIAKNSLSEIKTDEYLYPVYSSQTVNHGILGYDKTFDFEGDYLTWTTDGANAGRVFKRGGRFRCTNVCGLLVEKENTIGFANKAISELLNKETPKHVSFVGNPKLMNGVMGDIKIKLPSLPEQEKIASLLSTIDKKIELEEKLLEKLKEYKKGLLQQMFV